LKGSPSTKNWTLILGISLLLLGTGPLASYLLAARLGYGDDPNPNPVLLGMLAGLTFYPSLGLIAWGFYRRLKERKSGGR
jgi:uncharacterized BrkB/YihY/UPF0761 family membrane protein